MADSIFGKIKGFMMEDEPGDAAKAASVPVATPKPVLAATIAPTTAIASASTDGPTPEELKAAEVKISSWTGFRSLENLKKFATIEAKLKSKITDPEALRTATFEMAEVAGIDKAAVIAEAKGAVAKLHVKLTESVSVLTSEVAAIETQEKTETVGLVNTITDIEKQLESLNTEKLRLQGELGNVPTKYEGQRIRLAQQHDLTQQLAVLFIDQWSPVTESK